jgi:hypothetical protein
VSERKLQIKASLSVYCWREESEAFLDDTFQQRFVAHVLSDVPFGELKDCWHVVAAFLPLRQERKRRITEN